MSEEEVAVDQSEEIDQGTFVVDDEPIATEDGEETLAVPETESQEVTDEPKEVEQEEIEKEETPDETAKLKAERDQAIRDKNRAFVELRKAQQKPKQEEQALSKDQLIAIMTEHKDDPEAMLQVTQYIAEQAAKSSESKIIDAGKLSQVKAITDKYVSEKYSQLLDENHPIYSQALQLKDQLGIADHPHADYLVGNTILANNYEAEMEASYKRGLAEGQGKLTETNRKKDIKEGKLESPTTKKTASTISTPDHDSVAGILGLTGSAKDTYVKMMTKKGKGA